MIGGGLDGPLRATRPGNRLRGRSPRSKGGSSDALLALDARSTRWDDTITRAGSSEPSWPSPRHSPCRVTGDRKSTRLNSSHGYKSYAVFCFEKKNECH